MSGQVLRAGLPIRRFRQLYGLAAVRSIAGVGRVDLIHVHLGEDLAIVPPGRWAASWAGVPLVVTVHCSLEHTLVDHDEMGAPTPVLPLALHDLDEPILPLLVRAGIDRGKHPVGGSTTSACPRATRAPGARE